MLTLGPAYFGDGSQLVHGIHMLPLMAPSTYLRPRGFVREEWDAFFALPVTTQSIPHTSAVHATFTSPFHSLGGARPASLHVATPGATESRTNVDVASSKRKEKAKADGAYVDGGWRGILFANLAIVDAKTAYGFFKDGVGGVWDERWIDVGATRSWYLVWCASLGGVR